MKHVPSRFSPMRGFSSGNFLFFLAVLIVGLIVRNELSGPKLEGKTATSLIQEMGQPVAKSTIPRPN